MKLKIVTLIAALAGLLFMSIPIVSIIRSVKLKKNGIATEGIVLGVTSQRKGLPKVTVAFDTRDNKQITSDAVKRQYVATGDVVSLWYNPSLPQKIDFGDTIGYNMRGVVAGGFLFIFCFFYFVRFSIKDSANKKIIRSGMKIAAEFVSIDRDERFRAGDNNPWIIKCRWTDNRNNKEYYFVSKTYTIDPAPYLNGRSHIDVFIDPADPAKYLMDTSFMPKGNNTIG